MDATMGWTFVSSDREPDLLINDLAFFGGVSWAFRHFVKGVLALKLILLILLEWSELMRLVRLLQNAFAVYSLRLFELVGDEDAYLFL